MDTECKHKNGSSWNHLLESLKVTLKSKEVNKAEITKMLSEYKSKEEDWEQYVFFDDKSYTRNLVDAGSGIYNLMLLAWNPAQGTCIHNHADSNCFLKILSGSLREIRYKTPEEGKEFEVIRDSVNERDDVTYIEDSIGVHEMKNNTPNQAISLHLYIPPIENCSTYNRETAETSPCSMTLNSIDGVKLHKPKPTDDDIKPCC